MLTQANKNGDNNSDNNSDKNACSPHVLLEADQQLNRIDANFPKMQFCVVLNFPVIMKNMMKTICLPQVYLVRAQLNTKF